MKVPLIFATIFLTIFLTIVFVGITFLKNTQPVIIPVQFRIIADRSVWVGLRKKEVNDRYEYDIVSIPRDSMGKGSYYQYSPQQKCGVIK